MAGVAGAAADSDDEQAAVAIPQADKLVAQGLDGCRLDAAGGLDDLVEKGGRMNSLASPRYRIRIVGTPFSLAMWRTTFLSLVLVECTAC